MSKNSEIKKIYSILDEREKQNNSTHIAQDKAIDKAYEAQKDWNTTHNDLTRKMENFVTRTELWTLIAVIISLIGLYLVVKQSGEVMKTFVSWAGFEADVDHLVKQIKYSGKEYNGVFGIPRGGLILAVRLSHKLNIPMLLGGLTEKSLCVDDIADSGNALRPYMERTKCDVMTLFRSKHCTLNPTLWVHDSENWVVFPWERNDVA